MKIGNQIRHRRTELNLSRGELANKIQVTPSAIANYENGISYPKPDILVALMNALEVDANYLYRDYLSPRTIQRLYRNVLRPEEKESILKYRELSESRKSLVRLIIDEEYKRMNQSEYINLPFYRPGIRKAHSGFLFQDTNQTIRVRREHIPKDSDFCFRVLIDRYQPVFQKNDIMAVQRINASHNEIGLFWFNGIYYIRILSQEGSIRRLRSLNVIDPDIVVNEQEQLSVKSWEKFTEAMRFAELVKKMRQYPNTRLKSNKKAESCAIFGTRFCFFIFIPEQIPVLSLH